ncbi:MAG: HAD-IIIC family phosphatase [Nevskia sp.]
MRLLDLYWLPALPGAGDELRRLAAAGAPEWRALTALARTRLDFIQTNRLDKLSQKHYAAAAPADALKSLKLALLSSSTADHLLPGLRVAALRRNFHLQTWLGDYGQYLQELQDGGSALHGFAPNVLLFAFHAQHLFGAVDPALPAADAAARVESVAEQIRGVWRLARRRLKGQIIQQAVLPTGTALIGSNEHRLPGSLPSLVEQLNARLRGLADAEGVDLLALDRVVAQDGLRGWHDAGLWHRAKQEISPSATPAYGDLVLRLVAAQQGRSAKCLVLDLDNTLWGGVIGDDGLEGIKLGQGSGSGEAYVAFQHYARELSRRGVILAVCSKNDEDNAKSPFERHPDMVLKLSDIACFVANWTDKATNLRAIAEQLNIGIDALVFADDNPFERNIVRRELPMVEVPELPEDPTYYGSCLADGGYFEALQITPEDFERSGQYRANVAREGLRAAHTDLAGYLQSLGMELRWQPFDRVGLQRIVQLINKTNQFNLTTRRYTEQEVLAIMDTPGSLTLQLRLLDQFGDNGIIGIVIGKMQSDDDLLIDTWLMSCRVLGRGMEEETLNLVAAEALRLGATLLVGEYLPSKKNGMVREHYPRLGFALAAEAADGATTWTLALADYRPFPTFINTQRNAARG